MTHLQNSDSNTGGNKFRTINSNRGSRLSLTQARFRKKVSNFQCLTLGKYLSDRSFLTVPQSIVFKQKLVFGNFWRVEIFINFELLYLL